MQICNCNRRPHTGVQLRRALALVEGSGPPKFMKQRESKFNFFFTGVCREAYFHSSVFSVEARTSPRSILLCNNSYCANIENSVLRIWSIRENNKSKSGLY